MHVFIQALHDVRKTVNVHGFRLFSPPLGKGFYLTQVCWIVNAATFTGRQRIIRRIKTGKMAGGVIRIDSKGHRIIKIVHKNIIQLITWNKHYQDNNQRSHSV